MNPVQEREIILMCLRKHLKFLSLSCLSLICWMTIITSSLQAKSLPNRIQTQAIQAQSSLLELRQRLDQRVQGMMERQHIPGMAVAVIKDGSVLAMKGYGTANRQTQAPVDVNTRFPIGSITKPFTAMAVMILVEQGQLNLDLPIRQYLDTLPQPWQLLTLRQLLSHTSGISETSALGKLKQISDFPKVTQAALEFPPGESWDYSNSGYYLAGLIIEKVTGQTYADFMRNRIFQPLGMNQTQALLSPSPDLAAGYEWNRKFKQVTLSEDKFAYAAGNIISTISDMTKWVQAIEQGKLLKPSGYQQLWTATLLKNGRSSGYGLGWFVSRFNQHPSLEHGGNVDGYSAGLYHFPKDRLNVIVLTNNVNTLGSMLANAIAGIYEPKLSFLAANPQADPNPEFTSKFLALLQGNQNRLPFTPQFQLTRNTARGRAFRTYMKLFQPVTKLDFLHVEPNGNDRTYYYRTQLKGNPSLAVVTVTAQGQIASYGALQQP
jgi:D-alanyl-D-alanine carboxypeptidase